MGLGGGRVWVWGVALFLALILALVLAQTDINRDSDGDGLRWVNPALCSEFIPFCTKLLGWSFYLTFRDHVDDLDDDNDGILDIEDDDDDGDGIRDREVSFGLFLIIFSQ